MGDKGYEASDQIRKDEPRVLYEDSEGGNHDLENETSLILRNGSRMHVEDSGWTWNTRPSAVLTTLKYDEGC